MNAAGWTISIIAIAIVVVIALWWGRSTRSKPTHVPRDDETTELDAD